MHLHPHKQHRRHNHIHRHRHRHKCTPSSNRRIRLALRRRPQPRLSSTLLRLSRRQRGLKLSLLQNQRRRRRRLHPLPIASQALNPPTHRPLQSRLSIHDLKTTESKVCLLVPRPDWAQSLATPTPPRRRRIEPRDLHSVSTPWRLTRIES